MCIYIYIYIYIHHLDVGVAAPLVLLEVLQGYAQQQLRSLVRVAEHLLRLLPRE